MREEEQIHYNLFFLVNLIQANLNFFFRRRRCDDDRQPAKEAITIAHTHTHVLFFTNTTPLWEQKYIYVYMKN